jgi:hypothetical protein
MIKTNEEMIRKPKNIKVESDYLNVFAKTVKTIERLKVCKGAFCQILKDIGVNDNVFKKLLEKCQNSDEEK